MPSIDIRAVPSDQPADPSFDGAVLPSPWTVLAITGLPFFAVFMDTTVLYVAFTDMGRTFADASASQLSWVLNAYTIVFGALLVPAGRFADLVGRKRLFLSGVAIFTLSSALCGLAPSPALLIAARVLQAVGAALLVPASVALVLAAFPRPQWPIALSAWSCIGALACAFGPAIGSSIVHTAGWRWALYINLPLGVIAFLLSRARLPESTDVDQGAIPDPLGVLVAIAAPALLAVAIIGADSWGITGIKTLGAFTGGILMVVLLVTESAKSSSPLVNLTLFQNRNFRVANLASWIFFIGFSAMFFGLILFLVQVWKYPILRAGMAMTPGPLMVIPFAVLAGRTAVKRGHRGLLVAGGIAFALSSLALPLFATEQPAFLSLFLPVVLAFGAAVGFVIPSLLGIAMHGVPLDRLALAMGVNEAIRQVGAVMGVASVIAFTSGRDNALASFQWIFALLVFCGALTALTGWFASNDPRNAAADSSNSPKT